MLSTLSQILTDAYKGGYAVGAFNCLSLENVRGAIAAAEALRSPIILELAEVQFECAPPEHMAPIFLRAAKDVTVPVCVHLDHGQSFETCARAIKLGFNSVMIDSSQLPFEENVRVTSEVTHMAHAFGVDVEAELGTVGTVGVETDDTAHKAAGDIFTNVDQSAEFVQRTGIQALAVAIGNMHGKYVSTPHLNIGRLKEIKQRNAIPLVLHGGSGTSEADFKACVHNGICKINVATALQLAVTERVRQYVKRDDANYIDMKAEMVNATREAVEWHMRLFESAGRA